MAQSRRKFLQQTGCALTGAALVASLDQLNLISAMAQTSDAASDYIALDCVFLSGGNDCNNTIVSLDQYDGRIGSTTTGYSNVRVGSSLAIPRTALLSVSPIGGGQYGLHPNLSPEVANSATPFK